jgi:hypothetical protein
MYILHTHSLEGFLALIATLVHAIWLAIPTLFTHIGTFSPLISWPPPCNHLTKLPPSSLHTTRMVPSPPSLVEFSANGSHEKTNATPTPWYRIAFSRGGGGHLPPSGTPNCLDAPHEARHAPTPILTIRNWTHLLHTHTH